MCDLMPTWSWYLRHPMAVIDASDGNGKPLCRGVSGRIAARHVLQFLHLYCLMGT